MTAPTLTEKPLKLWQTLEQTETHYWIPLYENSGMPGARISSVKGALCGTLPHLDILACNRAFGFTSSAQITDATLQQIIDFYREAGVSRFFLSPPPAILTDRNKDLLQKHGFTYYNNWTKLFRVADLPDTPGARNLEIREIGDDQAELYGDIIIQAFGWPEELKPAIVHTVGLPGFRHYFAVKDDEPVAAAALFIHQKNAAMALAGTLEKRRGLGAQQALLSARIRAAREAGARFIFSETAEETPGKPVISYRNMARAGFRTAYQRPNFIYYF